MHLPQKDISVAFMQLILTSSKLRANIIRKRKKLGQPSTTKQQYQIFYLAIQFSVYSSIYVVFYTMQYILLRQKSINIICPSTVKEASNIEIKYHTKQKLVYERNSFQNGMNGIKVYTFPFLFKCAFLPSRMIYCL